MCICAGVWSTFLFKNFVQFLEEFNEMWRKLLDGIIWEFHYQIKFLLDDKIKEPQQNMVCITYSVWSLQFEILNFNPNT